jgi:N-acetylneuraminate synthase
MTKTFIISEFGMLHDGNLDTAFKMAQTAKECGADAVKFQTHIAQAETLKDAPMPSFFKGEPRWDYFTRTAFSLAQWKALKAHCDKIGIEFLSSPFSVEAVELLEKVGMARYKIPSGEVSNIPFLDRVAETGKPVLLSSGMSDWKELDLAFSTLKNAGATEISVLQCTSLYPTPPEKVGLNVMQEMKKRFKTPVGLSDQSLTNYACLAAVTLGAEVIEKHIKLKENCYGSDVGHSVLPEQFSELVKGIRAIEKMRNNPIDKDDISAFVEMKRVFEKSVVSLVDIPKGAKISEKMVGVKKPGGGLPPSKFKDIIGRSAKHDIKANTTLKSGDLE